MIGNLFVVQIWRAQSLAYLAMFSSVGGGKRSGVNLEALPMCPAIFILPCIKAIYGLSFPRQTFSKSSSVIVKVASALAGAPALHKPCPFFKSIS